MFQQSEYHVVGALFHSWKMILKKNINSRCMNLDPSDGMKRTTKFSMKTDIHYYLFFYRRILWFSFPSISHTQDDVDFSLRPWPEVG